MKIKNPYYYSIEDMKAIIADWEAMGQKIDNYKTLEGIENLTEEEFIYLFGESTLYPNVYFPGPGVGYDFAYISDYDWHLVQAGYDPFINYKHCEEWLVNCELEIYETIQPSDLDDEIYFTVANQTFGQVLQQAASMDRFDPIFDEYGYIIGSEYFDLKGNIETYFIINDFGNEYDFMKVEDPDSLSVGELECSLADDLEYLLSIRSKILDFSATNISDVMNKLEMRTDETIYRLRIQVNISNQKFLITATFEPDISYYTINLVSEGTNGNGIIFLTDTTYSEDIPDLLKYYINTDLQFDLDFDTSKVS